MYYFIVYVSTFVILYFFLRVRVCECIIIIVIINFELHTRLADVAVVHARAARPAAGGRVSDLLFGLAAAPSDQTATTRFRSFLLLLLLLLDLVLVTAGSGASAGRRTGSRGRRALRTPRRLGMTDVRAGPTLQRTRSLVFRSVQLPGQHQQTFE